MKYSKFLALAFIFTFIYSCHVFAQVSTSRLRSPKELKYGEEQLPTKLNLQEVPAFHNPLQKSEKQYRIGFEKTSVTIPLNTRLRIKVDSYIDPKSAVQGDYFKAHVIEDFYFPSNPPWLLIPQGSWVRGAVTYVKKPTFFSHVGYLKVRLDQVVTPLGDIIPLSAELDIQEGILNADGELDPSVKEKNITNPDQFAEITQTIVIPFSEADSRVVNKFIDGALITLYFPASGETLHSGKELQIVLKKNIQFSFK